LHWLSEKDSASSNSHPDFPDCCQYGQVQLSSLPFLPPPLLCLYTSDAIDAIDAVEFWENIHFYNKALTFTLTGGDGRIMGELFDGQGPSLYKIHGELNHRLGPLEPDPGATPSFSQLYIYNPSGALPYQMQRNPE
jgi:hypothetical protein